MSDPLEDLSAELPPVREDEPESLRQDIFDELADHLQCSLHRERHRTGNEEQARLNVLQRFGNPATIARRLWWDAMKEKIMSLRIVSVMATITAVAMVALCVLLWQSQRQAAETQATLLAEQKQFLSALVEKLSTPLAPAPATNEKSTVPDGWGPLTVKLVDTQGTPVEGGEVRAWQEASQAKTNFTARGNSGTNGIADLGNVPYGNYRLQIQAPLGMFTSMDPVLTIVRPGSQQTTVVCPAPSDMTELEVDLHPPVQFQTASIAYVVTMQPSQFKIQDQKWCSMIDGSQWYPQTEVTFVLNANGEELWRGYGPESIEEKLKKPSYKGRMIIPAGEVTCSISAYRRLQPGNAKYVAGALNIAPERQVVLEKILSSNAGSLTSTSPLNDDEEGESRSAVMVGMTRFTLPEDSEFWTKVRDSDLIPNVIRVQVLKNDAARSPAAAQTLYEIPLKPEDRLHESRISYQLFQPEGAKGKTDETGWISIPSKRSSGQQQVVGLKLSWGEYTYREVNLPQSAVEPFQIAPFTIPESPPAPVDAKFDIPIPPEIDTTDLQFLINIQKKDRQIGDTTWYPADGDRLKFMGLLVRADGQIINAVGQSTTGIDANFVRFFVGETPPLTEGTYHIESVTVCRTASLPTDEPYEDGLRRVQLLTQRIASGRAPEQKKKFTFTAAPGQDNVWKLEIPEDAWKHVIERQKKKKELPRQ